MCIYGAELVGPKKISWLEFLYRVKAVNLTTCWPGLAHSLIDLKIVLICNGLNKMIGSYRRDILILTTRCQWKCYGSIIYWMPLFGVFGWKVIPVFSLIEFRANRFFGISSCILLLFGIKLMMIWSF